MWLKFILLPVLISALHDNSVRFSLDYFKYRHVKFVCLFSCEKGGIYDHEFSKLASKYLIATSKVEAAKSKIDFDVVLKCLNQRFVSVGVLIDSRCSNFEEILQFAAENMQFNSMHKWLVIDESSEMTRTKNDTNSYLEEYNGTNKETVDVLDNINTNLDSDIIVSKRTDTHAYELYEIFNFGKERGGNMIVDKIGKWDDAAGLTMERDLNEYKYYRRWDFKQLSMKMVVVVSNPSKDFDPDSIIASSLAPGVAVITQTSAMVLNVVSEIHNFRYNYTVTDRWIADFSRKSQKVAASSLYFRTQDITPVIRYMPSIYDKIDVVYPPLTSIETRYYYRIPTYGAGKLENQFLRPLTTEAWLCVLVVFILCATVLLLSAKVERRTMPAQYAVFSVLASFCQQYFEDCGDSTTTRTSAARKIGILVTGLSCLLIYNYYTSSVVSWLLNGPPPSINSLQQLLESPLELIYEDIGYTRSWLQTPSYYYNKRNAKVEDDIREKKVFNKKADAPLLLPVDDGIEMVKAGGYAYHTEVNTANLLISRKFTQSELCELGSLQSMEKTMLYPAVQKNSPYKEFFVWSLSRLVERGIVSCIQHRTSSATAACEGSSPRALALGGAAPAFLLLAFGYLLATFIVVLERLYYRHFGGKKADETSIAW